MYHNLLPSMEEQNGDDWVKEEGKETKECQVDNANNGYPPPSLTTMRCGGCDAKVGSQFLTRVLDAVSS